MKDASEQNPFDILKSLAGAKNWSELGKIIGFSKQRISQARDAGKLSANMILAAAEALKIPLDDLREKLGIVESSNIYNCGHIDWTKIEDNPLWKEFQVLLRKNEVLYREKEDLMRENGDLKSEIARLQERLKAVRKGEETNDNPSEAKSA